MLEIKRHYNGYEEWFGRLGMDEERISELEDMTVEVSKTEMQREKD